MYVQKYRPELTRDKVEKIFCFPEWKSWKNKNPPSLSRDSQVGVTKADEGQETDLPPAEVQAIYQESFQPAPCASWNWWKCFWFFFSHILDLQIVLKRTRWASVYCLHVCHGENPAVREYSVEVVFVFFSKKSAFLLVFF